MNNKLRYLYFAALLALSACSSVSVTRLTDDDQHLTVHVEAITHVKHAEYERTVLLRTMLQGMAKEHPFWTICVPATAPENSADFICEGDAAGPDVSLLVAIDDIQGVSDTGNVYGGKLEGRGDIRVTATISAWNGAYLKHFSLQAKGESEPIARVQMAKGIGRAAERIAQRIVELTEDACPEIVKSGAGR
jgi:hypothetical protein